VLRHELLKNLHRLLKPRSYFEIGVNIGSSLTLSRTRTVAVDPFYRVTQELHCNLHLVRTTSDEFFARKQPLEHFDEPVIDLAFIDGMHLSEYALRDFINVERFTHAGTVIVIDDMLPRSHNEAARDRQRAGLAGAAWTGDVYKITSSLRRHRRDLVLLEVDTRPTGTAVILLPDRGSDVLHDCYDALVEEYVTPDPQQVPPDTISRSRAIAPERLLEAPVWAQLRAVRSLPDAQARPRVRQLLDEAGLLSATP
jgi:predicted O-methyltransferase YrrM